VWVVLVLPIRLYALTRATVYSHWHPLQVMIHSVLSYSQACILGRVFPQNGQGFSLLLMAYILLDSIAMYNRMMHITMQNIALMPYLLFDPIVSAQTTNHRNIPMIDPKIILAPPQSA